ncbi:LysR family transcriptional regulator [Peribacillus sp. FSL K6-1552]|uniref:LysR family transcriptional regulator n=1 Tax=Peribacillus sp. FSL K6-1552 TaxID=2954514 RepID=UPI0030FC16CF
MNTLEKMETFIVLAECRSFTEAARRLYCSQPTISHHINHLEQDFDSRLFHRTGRKVELTKQGEVLLTYAKQILSLVDEASVTIKKVDYFEQTLSVFVSNYIADYFFADLLHQYKEISRKKCIEINSFCYDDLKRSLQDNLTNFAIMPIYPEDYYLMDHYDTSVLFEDELSLIFPNDYLWDTRKTLYCRDLHNKTVLLPKSHYLQQYIKSHLRSRQVKVRYLQMSNFELIKKAVKAGHGIAFLPSFAVAEELSKGELVSRPVSGLSIKRKNGLVIRKNTQLTDYEQDFCNKLKQHFLQFV